MESPWPENLSSYRRTAIQELAQGRDFTNQLQTLLTTPMIPNDLESAEDLLMKILRSFSETISILSSTEVSDFPAKRSACPDCQKSEDSGGESSKSSTIKDRRGSYKRRKNSDSFTKVTSTLIDDGYAWRKYGQKTILNTVHPRNYYRCTHKHDQGCQATKQVQKTEAEPSMYKITYNGHHTCQNILKAPQIISDSAFSPNDSSVLFSFQSTNNHRQENPFLSSFPATIKEESTPSDDHTAALNNQSSLSSDYFPSHNNQSSLSSDYFLSHELSTYNSYGDVISGMNNYTASKTESFDMEIMSLEDVCNFEF